MGSTGFGQLGEIAGSTGIGRTGITGRRATGLTPLAGRRIPFAKGRVIPGTQIKALEKTSIALYSPLRYMRDKGSKLEEYSRFMLLWDGVKQGMDPEEAAARVNKFLINYQDISTLDKNARAIQPFWMWMTRNLPLQIENMWMSPSTYVKYNAFKNALTDEEGTSPFVPDFLKEQGAFKVKIGKTWYLNPQLGFPGAGALNPIQVAAGGDVYELLSGITPALRVQIEREINKQLFSGAPIMKPSLGNAENERIMRSYLLSQILSPLGVMGRYLSSIPGDEPKWLQTLTGSKLDKELASTLSTIGMPGFRLSTQQEKNEILRRYYLLREQENRAKRDQPDYRPGG